MEEILLPALAVGVGAFLLYMAAFFIARMFGKNKIRAFQDYLKQNYPDLPEGSEIFPAKQKSKGIKIDIALAINEPKKEIILLLDNKGEGLTHKVYAFKDLKEVNSSNQIIGRGALPKTYSYEQTLTLAFKDGGSFDLVAENVSNKHGNDQGAEVVKKSFAPWEEKLNKILK